MSYEYVKQFYGVQPEPGMRVTSEDGKYEGNIVRRKCYDNYVWVKIDGRNHASPFHPLDLIYPAPVAQKEQE